MEEKDLEEKPVIININKTIKMTGEGNLYLIISILCLLFIFGLGLIFGLIYLLQPEVLFSPPEDIGSFLLSLDPDFHRVVYGNTASLKETEKIKEFILNYLDSFQESKISGSNEIVMGIGSSFSEAPYLSYLKDNDSIVVYDAEKNSLYIYSKDLDKLNEISDILKKEVLDYSAIKIRNSEIEELNISDK